MRERKKQLHDRVLRRQSQLESELALIDVDAQSGHARALCDALAQLDTHLGADWASIDGVQSAALADWLAKTRVLVGGNVLTKHAEAIWRRLEARGLLHLYGVPTA